ncbi:hypothetical protein HK12_08445 [Acetobacter orientalis]|uniref:Uncharacterized protein n=1 Tax=Acetobacter orientalis TaxID=146474 RepID=A0A252A0B1_9PROT|nr:hypothetical protein HK12_08445 [Acetobacter orientalis]
MTFTEKTEISLPLVVQFSDEGLYSKIERGRSFQKQPPIHGQFDHAANFVAIDANILLPCWQIWMAFSNFLAKQTPDGLISIVAGDNFLSTITEFKHLWCRSNKQFTGDTSIVVELCRTEELL